MTVSLRRFWLGLNAWLLPLGLAFGLAWLVAAVSAAISGASAPPIKSVGLLWFVALNVYFLNAAWQDGDSQAFDGNRPGRLMARLLPWAWITVALVAAVATWGIWLRVAQHGWTEDRIWAMLVAVLALGYTVGYWLPIGAGEIGARKHWMPAIGRVNIAFAALTSVALALLVSPLADARRLATHDQFTRLQSGRIEVGKFDFGYLRHEGGVYGQRLLAQLAQGLPSDTDGEIARQASAMLAQPVRANYARRSVVEAQPRPAIDAAIEDWSLASGPRVPATFLDRAHIANTSREKRNCLDLRYRCAAWMQDLDADGNPEIVLLMHKPGTALDFLFVYEGKAPFSAPIGRRGVTELPARFAFGG